MTSCCRQKRHLLFEGVICGSVICELRRSFLLGVAVF